MPWSQYTVATAKQLGGWSPRRNRSTPKRTSQSTEQYLGSTTPGLLTPPDSDQTRRTAATGSVESPSKSEQISGQLDLYPRKLTISKLQLGEIMTALVESPLIVGSLQCKRIEFEVAKNKDSVYTLANGSAANQAAQEESMHLPLINGAQGGIAVIHTRTEGLPVLYTSAAEAPDSIKVDQPSNMGLSYGLELVSRLHIRTIDGGVPHIMMQCVHSAIGLSSSAREGLISVERDVTEAFEKTAIEELLRACCVFRENLRVEDEVEGQRAQYTSAVAAVGLLVAAIKTDNAETCDMQTLTLVSFLRRLRVGRQDIVIFHASAVGKDGRTVVIPAYVSQRLCHELAKVPDKASGFIKEIATALQPYVSSTEKLELCDSYGRDVLFRCQPLFRDAGSRTSAWAVLVDHAFKEMYLYTSVREDSVFG